MVSGHKSEWVVWYDVKQDAAEASASGFFGDRLQEICTIDAIDKHHQHEVYMKSAEELPKSANLYVFREGVRPMWENLPEGGAWSMKIKRGDVRVGEAWRRLVSDLRDDGLGSKNVAGVVLSSRAREYSLNVWLTCGQTSVLRFEIMDRLRKAWGLLEGDMIQFKDFRESLVDDSSRVNAVMYRVKGEETKKTGLLEKPANKKYILPDPVTGSFTFKY
jgi:hypothetical protein